ncbi:hypothetical protein BV283P1_00032 [Phocaeicola phage BV283P1]|nr:hypothetical protein BV185P1_00032 [Phocaeicola phage BV185P1]WAX10532.1 hypothetical protein BV283P1_00032 [Phocaeicola phage BV283P1]WAX10640.1 hypothetical protein BV283P3_00032 [Phocaeicola phage BV283P3]
MVDYIQLEIKCQGKKTEAKINGRRIKSYSDYEEVLKTIDPKALSTMYNQLAMVEGILCSY